MSLNFRWAVRMACALAVSGAACVANAGLIDIAFYNSGFGGNQPTGAAVLGQAGDQWNFIDAANCPTCPVNTGLIDATGGATSAILNFTADGAVPSATAGTMPDPDLMNNYIFNNSGGSITVSLTGLVASQSYELALYVASFDAGGGDRALSGIVSGASTVPFAATGDPQPTFVDGENVVILPVTSDAAGNLTITESDASPSVTEVDLNGLQLQDVVPEPSSLGLLCLGGSLLVWRSRRFLRG